MMQGASLALKIFILVSWRRKNLIGTHFEPQKTKLQENWLGSPNKSSVQNLIFEKSREMKIFSHTSMGAYSGFNPATGDFFSSLLLF